MNPSTKGTAMTTLFVFAALIAGYLIAGQIGMCVMALVMVLAIAMMPARRK
jgi:hypothetical protein